MEYLVHDEFISALRMFMQQDLNSRSLHYLDSVYFKMVDLQRELRKYVELVSKRRFEIMFKKDNL